MKRILIAFTALAAFFTACDTGPIENALDDFALVIGLEPINTNAVVTIYDAATGELVSGDVTVTFGGPNGEDVIDIFSDQIEETEVEGGILAFGIKNELEPNAENPADVFMTFRAPGYLETTRQVQFVTVGSDDFSIELIPLNALPANIVVSETTSSTDENGNPVPPEDGDFGGVGKIISTPSVMTARSGWFVPMTGEKNNTNDWSNRQRILLNGNAEVHNGYIQKFSGTFISGMSNNTGVTPIPFGGSGGFYQPVIQYSFDVSVGRGEYLGTLNAAANDWGLIVHQIDFNLPSAEAFALLNQENLFMIQSDLPDYKNAVYTPISGGIQTISRPTSQRNLVSQLGDLKTGGASIFQISGVNHRFFVLSSGEHFKYSTIAFQPSIEQFTINLNRNGFDEAFKIELNLLGYNFSLNIPAGSNSTSTVLTRSPITASAKLPWTEIKTTVDLSQIAGNVINLELPAKPVQLVDAKVNILLSCPNTTESVRLNSLPGVPVLYRKTGTGGNWSVIQPNNITWNYDSSTQTLGGGSFTALVEDGQSYDFKLTVDGKVYKKDNLLIQLVNGEYTYTETVEDDYCD